MPRQWLDDSWYSCLVIVWLIQSSIWQINVGEACWALLTLDWRKKCWICSEKQKLVLSRDFLLWKNAHCGIHIHSLLPLPVYEVQETFDNVRKGTFSMTNSNSNSKQFILWPIVLVKQHSVCDLESAEKKHVVVGSFCNGWSKRKWQDLINLGCQQLLPLSG